MPNTGIYTGVNGILLVGVVGMLIIAITRGKNKKYKILSVMLVTSLGVNTLQIPVIAVDSSKLSIYNTDFSVFKNGKLLNPIEIPGYNYVGFIKNEYSNFKMNKNNKELEGIRNSNSSESSKNRNIIKPEYVVLEAPAHRSPARVQGAEYCVTVLDSVDDDPHRHQVVDVVELVAAHDHLLVNRVVVLGATGDRAQIGRAHV